MGEEVAGLAVQSARVLVATAHFLVFEPLEFRVPLVSVLTFLQALMLPERDLAV